MSQRSELRGVIFDMDGVLVDSEPLHQRTEIQTLAYYGVLITPEQLSEFTGRPARHVFGELIRRHELPVTFEDIYADHEARLIGVIEQEAVPMPGANDLLDSLKAAGLGLALVTSSSRRLLSATLRAIGLGHQFAVTVAGDEIERGKPDPQGFLLAAKQLGLTGSECVVIEDSTSGVRASRRAQMFCLGFRTNGEARQDLAGADAIVDSFVGLDATRLNRIFSDHSTT